MAARTAQLALFIAQFMSALQAIPNVLDDTDKGRSEKDILTKIVRGI